MKTQDPKHYYDLSIQIIKNGFSDKSSAEEQIHQLSDLIRYHEWRYYVINDPLLSDKEYDTLFKLLEKLELANPLFVKKDSPTQRVSSDLNGDFANVEHLTAMLSLDNSYNLEDLQDFDERIKKLALIDKETDLEYAVEPKYDGGSIALVFEDDQLSRAATRGNGVKGDEITHNIKTLKSIPIHAAFSQHGLKKVELRGEAIIRKDTFEKINKQREIEEKSLFANPRNAATGGLRMKDPKESSKRGIEAFIYQLGYAENDQGQNALNQFKKHDETIALLGSLGFKIPVEERKVCKNIQEVFEFVTSWENKRDKYPYEIDGMVIKVNDLKIQEKCGFTSHHPRWAIAFKFKAKQATSKLVNIEYQIGKIGSITPVAKIEPVQLAGVTVSSISLHNEDFIKSKDIRLGDTVLVERAGDVIPYIVKSMDELRDGSENEIQFPSNCPSCETKLIRSEKEAAWRCPNFQCEAQVLQRMIFHVSKGAMDIDGFGKSLVERFYEEGFVKSLADIYRLDYEAISQLEGFGERSSENLRKAIDLAKTKPISRLLHSLSIHHLGKKASKLIAAEIEHVLDLQQWTVEAFTEIKDIGPVVAENVIDWFSDEANVKLLQEMESLGVNLRQTKEDKPKVIAADAPLIGKTILFTGSLQQMGRKEAQKLAENAGAKNISAVSKNLNILVAGEKAGSKLKKAQALGTVDILTEEEFLNLINN